MPKKRRSSAISDSAFKASLQKPIVESDQPLQLKGLPPAKVQFTAKGPRK